MDNEVLEQVDELIMYLCDAVYWPEDIQDKAQLINSLSNLISARSFYVEDCYAINSYETRKGEEE